MSSVPRLPADVWRIFGAELTGGWPVKDTRHGITQVTRANATLMTTLSLVCSAWHEDVQYMRKPFYHSVVKEVRSCKSANRYLGAARGTQHDMPSRWYQLHVKYYLTKPWRQARKTRHADRHRARVIMGYVSKKQSRAGARHRAMLREMRTLVRQ